MSKAAQVFGADVLNERAQLLLRTLIRHYIRDGQPVGSRTLSRESGMELSAATIRNVMADLEEMGFIRAPHTSAGRIPTVQGYRFFVDSLLTVRPLDELAVSRLKGELQGFGDSKALIKSASQMLSGITHMAGVVTLPRRERIALRHVEFLPLSNRRVLAIVVLGVDRDYSQAELEQASNYLNGQFAGKDLHAVRGLLLAEMREDRERMNAMMLTALEMAERTFSANDDEGEDYVLAGETNLMEFADLSDMDKLRQLFEAFNTKRDLLHLLDHCIHADGVQIFIGEESGYQVLDECSIVTAPYAADGKVMGVLGVIGPTRMAYERVIPIVDITAKLLGAALNPRN